MTYCLGCRQDTELEIFNSSYTQNIIYQCNSCSCIFNKEEVHSKAFDSTEIPIPTISSKLRNHLIGFSGKIGAKSYFNYINKLVDIRFMTALDIGSGYGHFVKLLREQGINATGIESREQTKPYAVTKHIEYGFFDVGYKIPDNLDLICFSQMLYYNRKNYEVLEYARQHLSKNGIIFIATMNTESSHMDLMKNEMPVVGTNLMLSKKNFVNIPGFELVDYSGIKANFSLEHHSTKNKYLTFLKYYLGIKKPFSKDSNGNYAYILLKKL